MKSRRRLWASSERGRFSEGTVEPFFCWWMISKKLPSAATTLQTRTSHPQIQARYAVSAWCVLKVWRLLPVCIMSYSIYIYISLHTESDWGGILEKSLPLCIAKVSRDEKTLLEEDMKRLQEPMRWIPRGWRCHFRMHSLCRCLQ